MTRCFALLGVFLIAGWPSRRRQLDELTEDVLIAKRIGQGVVDGVECEHLAFRNFDTRTGRFGSTSVPAPFHANTPSPPRR